MIGLGSIGFNLTKKKKTTRYKEKRHRNATKRGNKKQVKGWRDLFKWKGVNRHHQQSAKVLSQINRWVLPRLWGRGSRFGQ